MRDERQPGNASAGCGRMATPAKFGGDFVHIYVFAFRPQTDAGQVRLNFFKDTGNNHGFDGADVIDEAFRIASIRASAREICFPEPEISNLVLVSESKVAINVFQQPGTGKRIGLVYLVANFCEVRAAAHEFTRNVVCSGLG